jgi:O-acetyl-ADP-ribose deacetylase (regulator of RNase III)
VWGANEGKGMGDGVTAADPTERTETRGCERRKSGARVPRRLREGSAVLVPAWDRYANVF